MPDAYQPTLHEVLKLAQDFPVVGEEKNILTVATALPMGGAILMDGPSRGGKDRTIDGVSNVYSADPRNSGLIYYMSSSGSSTSPYYAADRMNACPVHRWKDLVNLGNEEESIIKAHGGGEPAIREVTDITIQDVVEKRINVPHTLILFIASDNESVDLNDYPEVRNRCLIISVDGSAEQTARIQKQQALAEAKLWKPKIEREDAARIREHMRSLFSVVKPFDDGQAEFYNPGAVQLNEQGAIPALFTEGREDQKRLFRFMRAITLFHYKERDKVRIDGKPNLVVTPVDCWLGMEIFGENMVKSSLNLRGHDPIVLRKLRESGDSYTVGEIHQMLIQDGHNVTDRDVRRSLESMQTKGYVIRYEESPITFQASPMASYQDYDNIIDWHEVVRSCEEQVRKTLTPEDSQAFIDKWLSDEGLTTIHPITGEPVHILESTEQADEMKEAEDALKDALGVQWGSGRSSNSEADSESEAVPAPKVEKNGEVRQGTLS